MVKENITITSQFVIKCVALHSQTRFLTTKGEAKMDYIIMSIFPVVGSLIATWRPALAG